VKTPKHRLDLLLVDRGLAATREKARRLVLAGCVSIDGQKAGKAGDLVAEDAAIEVAVRMPYVSRGGLKLAAALDGFAIDVSGWCCLDVGSSTGGFTDCLLQRGAARVIAVDVGRGQLDWKLRQDPRVVVMERVNARYLQPGDVAWKARMLTCDVSFISVTLLLPALVPLLEDHAEMVVLVKPQFEVGRGQVGKGGIVRDPGLHRAGVSDGYYRKPDSGSGRQPGIPPIWTPLRRSASFPSRGSSAGTR
jgi:23S rRNA (cytidine1920-2'-O)/16S rRNA (cytidine1409-2'-O)-methyltransferase